jgi:gamma-glutamyltranspeptidase / glutathione hydrolase
LKTIYVFLSVFILFAQYIPYNNHIKYAKKSAIVASSKEAVTIGLKILNNGGNAYDASIAVSFMMAVTYPQAGNIGGGGFLVSSNSRGESFTIDYREKAPLSASRDMFLDDLGNAIKGKSSEGFSSAGVPGTVDGLWKIHQKYGSLKWADLVKDAIIYAEKGFPINNYLANSLNYYRESFIKDEEAKRIFVKDALFEAGDTLKQVDLAKTLKSIAKLGRDGFYKGHVVKQLVSESEERNGYFQTKDFDVYSSVYRDAIRFTYRDSFEIITMAPPSSGGVVLFGILKSFESFEKSEFEFHSAKFIQVFTEIFRQVYADRSEFLGDPDFEIIPLKRLLSEDYISKIVKEIEIGGDARLSEDVKPLKSYVYESDQTTHFIISDQFGNIVSNTTTLNSSYGSKIIAKGTGFFLNNEMDDFSVKAGEANEYGLLGNEKNAIKAEKRMLSSMTPTIILKNGKPYVAVGSPGGSMIITTVAQAIIRLIDYDMNIDEAVNYPRIHHQWFPDTIRYEPNAISVDSRKILEKLGYSFELKSVIGDCHGILFTKEGINIGVSSRGNGYGAGF